MLPRFCQPIVNKMLVLILVAGATFFGICSVAVSDTTQQLQSAVHRLNATLGSDEKAEGWRRFLLLNVLETQSAMGEQADIAALQRLHQQFSSNTPGLDHPIFADVRVALENQILNLSFVNQINLQAAVQQAVNQFRPISSQNMQASRDQATRELAALRDFYRLELASYDRADAFYTLQLDEAIDFLNQITFELAPEISVGKMNSMIRDLTAKKRAVIERIDALPVRDGESPEPLDRDLELDPQTPAPDDDRNLQDLQAELKALEVQIAELETQRSDISRADRPRLQARIATFTRLVKFQDGFELTAEKFGDPYFVSTRLAFDSFVRVYYYGTEDNLQEDYLQRIERLAEVLPKLSDPADRLAAGIVGKTLEWLENARQVPQLVSAIRAKHSLPNAFVHVSGNLINRLGGRPVNDTRPIYENIKGRLVRGQASNNGQVSFDVIDDPNQVHLSIHAYSDISSNTFLQQGKIKAFVDASGQAEARRSILFNVGGLLAEQPYAAASINTFFSGTSSNCGLINRVAGKKFAESKSDSDRDAGSRVRKELHERFSSETTTPIEKSKAAFEKAQLKSRNRSNYIPEIYAHSRANQIVFVGKKSSKATLAAPNSPANFGSIHDVEVRLHDSLLANYVDPIFSGKTFTNEELAAELEELTGNKGGLLGPEGETEKLDEDEAFSITFTTVRPVQFEFEDNLLAVIVSGQKFAQGDKKIDAGLTIKIRFRVSQNNGELLLVRVGKAELDYVDAENKDAKIVAFRSFLDGRLNPKDKPPVSVKLPANLLPIEKIEALRDRPEAKNFRLNQFRIEKGWLYLGWNYVPAGNYSDRPVDLPAIWNEASVQQMDSIYSPTSPSVAE